MTRPLVLIGALGSLVLSLAVLLLAWNLLPNAVEAEERGVYAAWIVTWIMAWTAILCGVVLGVYMLLAVLRTGRAPAGTVARVR